MKVFHDNDNTRASFGSIVAIRSPEMLADLVLYCLCSTKTHHAMQIISGALVLQP